MKTIIEQLPDLEHVTIDNAQTKIFFRVRNVRFLLYERAVEIECEQYTQLKSQDGAIRDTSMVSRTYRVDNNTYAVPRKTPQGQPIMTEVQQPTGQFDENGMPVMETVQIPAAMGNYDFIYRMLQQFGFDQMLLGAVVSRVENTQNPLVWVQQS